MILYTQETLTLQSTHTHQEQSQHHNVAEASTVKPINEHLIQSQDKQFDSSTDLSIDTTINKNILHENLPDIVFQTNITSSRIDTVPSEATSTVEAPEILSSKALVKKQKSHITIKALKSANTFGDTQDQEKVQLLAHDTPNFEVPKEDREKGQLVGRASGNPQLLCQAPTQEKAAEISPVKDAIDTGDHARVKTSKSKRSFASKQSQKVGRFNQAETSASLAQESSKEEYVSTSNVSSELVGKAPGISHIQGQTSVQEQVGSMEASKQPSVKPKVGSTPNTLYKVTQKSKVLGIQPHQETPEDIISSQPETEKVRIEVTKSGALEKAPKVVSQLGENTASETATAFTEELSAEMFQTNPTLTKQVTTTAFKVPHSVGITSQPDETKALPNKEEPSQEKASKVASTSVGELVAKEAVTMGHLKDSETMEAMKPEALQDVTASLTREQTKLSRALSRFEMLGCTEKLESAGQLESESPERSQIQMKTEMTGATETAPKQPVTMGDKGKSETISEVDYETMKTETASFANEKNRLSVALNKAQNLGYLKEPENTASLHTSTFKGEANVQALRTTQHTLATEQAPALPKMMGEHDEPETVSELAQKSSEEESSVNISKEQKTHSTALSQAKRLGFTNKPEQVETLLDTHPADSSSIHPSTEPLKTQAAPKTSKVLGQLESSEKVDSFSDTPMPHEKASVNNVHTKAKEMSLNKALNMGTIKSNESCSSMKVQSPDLNQANEKIQKTLATERSPNMSSLVVGESEIAEHPENLEPFQTSGSVVSVSRTSDMALEKAPKRPIILGDHQIPEEAGTFQETCLESKEASVSKIKHDNKQQAPKNSLILGELKMSEGTQKLDQFAPESKEAFVSRGKTKATERAPSHSTTQGHFAKSDTVTVLEEFAPDSDVAKVSNKRKETREQAPGTSITLGESQAMENPQLFQENQPKGKNISISKEKSQAFEQAPQNTIVIGESHKLEQIHGFQDSFPDSNVAAVSKTKSKAVEKAPKSAIVLGESQKSEHSQAFEDVAPLFEAANVAKNKSKAVEKAPNRALVLGESPKTESSHHFKEDIPEGKTAAVSKSKTKAVDKVPQSALILGELQKSEWPGHFQGSSPDTDVAKVSQNIAQAVEKAPKSSLVLGESQETEFSKNLEEASPNEQLANVTKNKTLAVEKAPKNAHVFGESQKLGSSHHFKEAIAKSEAASLSKSKSMADQKAPKRALLFGESPQTESSQDFDKEVPNSNVALVSKTKSKAVDQAPKSSLVLGESQELETSQQFKQDASDAEVAKVSRNTTKAIEKAPGKTFILGESQSLESVQQIQEDTPESKVASISKSKSKASERAPQRALVLGESLKTEQPPQFQDDIPDTKMASVSTNRTKAVENAPKTALVLGESQKSESLQLFQEISPKSGLATVSNSKTKAVEKAPKNPIMLGESQAHESSNLLDKFELETTQASITKGKSLALEQAPKQSEAMGELQTHESTLSFRQGAPESSVASVSKGVSKAVEKVSGRALLFGESQPAEIPEDFEEKLPETKVGKVSMKKSKATEQAPSSVVVFGESLITEGSKDLEQCELESSIALVTRGKNDAVEHAPTSALVYGESLNSEFPKEFEEATPTNKKASVSTSKTRALERAPHKAALLGESPSTESTAGLAPDSVKEESATVSRKISKDIESKAPKLSKTVGHTHQSEKVETLEEAKPATETAKIDKCSGKVLSRAPKSPKLLGKFHKQEKADSLEEFIPPETKRASVSSKVGSNAPIERVPKASKTLGEAQECQVVDALVQSTPSNETTAKVTRTLSNNELQKAPATPRLLGQSHDIEYATKFEDITPDGRVANVTRSSKSHLGKVPMSSKVLGQTVASESPQGVDEYCSPSEAVASCSINTELSQNTAPQSSYVLGESIMKEETGRLDTEAASPQTGTATIGVKGLNLQRVPSSSKAIGELAKLEQAGSLVETLPEEASARVNREAVGSRNQAPSTSHLEGLSLDAEEAGALDKFTTEEHRAKPGKSDFDALSERAPKSSKILGELQSSERADLFLDKPLPPTKMAKVTKSGDIESMEIAPKSSKPIGELVPSESADAFQGQVTEATNTAEMIKSSTNAMQKAENYSCVQGLSVKNEQSTGMEQQNMVLGTEAQVSTESTRLSKATKKVNLCGSTQTSETLKAFAPEDLKETLASSEQESSKTLEIAPKVGQSVGQSLKVQQTREFESKTPNYDQTKCLSVSGDTQKAINVSQVLGEYQGEKEDCKAYQPPVTHSDTATVTGCSSEETCKAQQNTVLMADSPSIEGHSTLKKSVSFREELTCLRTRNKTGNKATCHPSNLCQNIVSQTSQEQVDSQDNSCTVAHGNSLVEAATMSEHTALRNPQVIGSDLKTDVVGQQVNTGVTPAQREVLPKDVKSEKKEVALSTGVTLGVHVMEEQPSAMEEDMKLGKSQVAVMATTAAADESGCKALRVPQSHGEYTSTHSVTKLDREIATQTQNISGTLQTGESIGHFAENAPLLQGVSSF